MNSGTRQFITIITTHPLTNYTTTTTTNKMNDMHRRVLRLEEELNLLKNDLNKAREWKENTEDSEYEVEDMEEEDSEEEDMEEEDMEEEDSEEEDSEEEEEEEEEEEYEVEDILDFWVENGKRKYLIKWRGYKEKTWEPLSNITNCDDILEEFHKQVEKDAKKALIINSRDKAYFEAVRKHKIQCHPNGGFKKGSGCHYDRNF